MNRCTSTLATMIAAGLAAAPSAAQAPLDLAGDTVTFSGTFEDFVLPDLPGTVFLFTVRGGDGGDAQVGDNNNCFNAGGQGATAQMSAVVGSGSGQLFPGNRLRFIVGEAGESQLDDAQNESSVAGGGGGSAVLYNPSGNNFRPMVVAGGGGGAYSGVFLGICAAGGQDGKPAEQGQCGGDGNGSAGGGDRGCDGSGGGSIDTGFNLPPVSGGGGGFSSSAALDIGGQRGGTTGGSGGFGTGQRGGFGFGGGGLGFGGGGGGGGYSGGGGGERGFAGGGGGSFTDASLVFNFEQIVRDSPGGGNGRISYSVFGQSHDSFAAPLPIMVNNQGLGVINGSTIAAGPTALAGDTLPPLSDVWYTYTNDSSEPVLFQLEWDTAEVHEITLVRQFPTPESFDTDGSAAAVVDPGARLLVRVESVADSFSIGVMVDVDSDGDGVADALDLCPGFDDTLDADGDMVPDGCDECEGFDDLADADGDLVPNGCDVCPDGDDVIDSDGDGIVDGCDTCLGFDDNTDADGDSVADGCDVCPGFDDFADADGDGIPNGCEDADGDGVADPFDVCPGFDDNADADGNGITDCLEDCDGDGIPNGLDEPFSAVVTDLPLGPIGDTTQTVSFSTCDESNVETILAVWTEDGTLITSLGGNVPGCAPVENAISLQLAAGSYFVGAYAGSALLGETDFEASYDPDRCPTSGFVRITIVDGDDVETTRGGTIFARELLRIPFEIVEAPSPCLADVNDDGELNGADFNAWLNAFSAGDAAADQNGDGNLDGADFNAWLANFAAGCDG